ncbi:MAG: TRAP transporter small permease [Synergistetes bacterium]|nr:TRAP transporter small permease [Synergistota bacterium]
MGRFFKALGTLDYFISGLTLIVLVAVTASGVLMRYVFNKPFSWQEEVQLWCYVWLTFFGGSVVFRHGGHVAIEVLYDLFPSFLRKVVRAFIYGVVSFLLLYLVFYGFSFVKLQYEIQRTTNVLHVPYYIVCLALPLGSLLMFLNWTIYFFKGGED